MSSENVEWTLADFVDAIAAEVDRAQDTLLLKAQARGLSVGLKGLDLDVAVNIRMSPEGQVYFRTVEAGTPSSTVLKLDLEEVLQSQVEEVRSPAVPLDGQPIETLPGITQTEIDALVALSITTVEGLLLFAKTPAMLRDLTRKSGIAEVRLRMWLGFPYLSKLTPPKGAAGQETVIEGGNLGARDAQDAVFFPGQQAEILSWSASRIVVKVPAGAVSGTVYARIDGALTNLLPWEPAPAAPPPPPPPPPPVDDFAVTSVTPNRGTVGTTLHVDILGRGFKEGTFVTFGPKVQLTGIHSITPTKIRAHLFFPAGSAGRHGVTITNPDKKTVTLANALEVVAAPAPAAAAPRSRKKKE